MIPFRGWARDPPSTFSVCSYHVDVTGYLRPGYPAEQKDPGVRSDSRQHRIPAFDPVGVKPAHSPLRFKRGPALSSSRRTVTRTSPAISLPERFWDVFGHHHPIQSMCDSVKAASGKRYSDPKTKPNTLSQPIKPLAPPDGAPQSHSHKHLRATQARRGHNSPSNLQ